MNKRHIPLFPFFIILYVLTLMLNVPLKKYSYDPTHEDLIYRMFGSLRGLIADWAYMKGEVYFHGGMPLYKTMKEKDVCADIEAGKVINPASVSRGEDHDHDTDADQNKDLYSKLYSNIKVAAHEHLPYAQQKEILPWFYIQVRFNPHDIEGYVEGAYWLKRLSKYAESDRFLREGEKNNPGSARIKTMIGDEFFRAGKYEEALPYLEQALVLWKEGKSPNIMQNDYERTDRDYTYTALAETYELTMQYEKAVSVYKELITIEPQRGPALLKKMETLQAFHDTLRKPTRIQ